MLNLCLQNSVLDLVYNFSAIIIITELDDWIGALICINRMKLDEEDEDEEKESLIKSGVLDQVELEYN